MVKRKNKDSTLHLTDKHHPGLAIASSIMALASAFVFIYACYDSGIQGGKADISVGIMGSISVFLAIAGFVMSFISLKMDNIRTLFPTIASLINGLLIIGYFIIYIWGSISV